MSKIIPHPFGFKPRKPIDQELSELVRVHAAALQFDNDSGTVEDIFDRINCGVAARGMVHKHTRNNPDKQWVVKFAIGGRQYYLGAHSQHTAARLYDCLLVAFEPYRKQKPSAEYEEAWFNFSRAQAETDLAHNDSVNAFIADLTVFWKKRGLLVTREERVKAQKVKRADRRSSVAAVESWAKELRTFIFEIQDEQEEQRKILDKILAGSNSKPQQEKI